MTAVLDLVRSIRNYNNTEEQCVEFLTAALASPPDARREALNEAARLAQSYAANASRRVALVAGGTSKTAALDKMEAAQDIAAAIRALADASVSATRKDAEPAASASDDVLDAMEGEEREMARRASPVNPTGAK